MPKVITTRLGRYRVDAVTIQLDREKADTNAHEVVGLEIGVARFREDGVPHDQTSLNVLPYLTSQQKTAIESFIANLVAAVKQAEDVT